MSTSPKTTTRIPRYRLSLVREAESPYSRDLLDRPDAVVEWLWQTIYHDAAQEQMSAVFLDTRNRLIGYQVAFVGTLSRIAIEPRPILAAGLPSKTSSSPMLVSNSSWTKFSQNEGELGHEPASSWTDPSPCSDSS